MAEQPNYLGLGLVALMLVVPQLTLIHPYLHLLIVAPLLVWIGCEGALAEQQKAPEESQVETVSRKDAMRFPFIGSAVLFGLYIVVKLVKKEYLDLLISIYFAALGAISIFECARPALTGALGMGSLHRYQFSFHWQRWKRREDAEPLAFSYSVFDVAVFALCAAGSVAYAVTKKWYLNNLLGCAFSIQGIQMLALGSWAIGFILLWGLFVYDVFWVFGTEVMVSVAKGLNAPVKILFPKALALMLSMDVRKGLASRPYFISNLIAYELGLAMTVGVMHFFDAAQPALLYLVPMCIGASLLMGLARGEVKEVINFSRERKEEEKVEKSD